MKKTIKDVQENFEKNFELVKLEKENKGLHETIDKLLKEIDKLRALHVPAQSKVIKLNATPEEEILDQQINFLQQASRIRMLEVNEAKMLDLYIKNKRLIQEKSTLNAEFSSLPDDISDEKLLQLVESGKYEQENESSIGCGEDSLE